jgi:hypothetical protein
MGTLLRYYSSCSHSDSVPSLRHRHHLGLVLAAALLVWCQASLLPVATAQQQPAPAPRVRVGVILNLTSLVGQRRKVGIEMAVEDYYAAFPGSSTRVALRFRDSDGDVVGAASAGNIYIYIASNGRSSHPPASSRALRARGAVLISSELRCIHDACFD